MTLARLQTLLDAYGADPGRWPAAERDAALDLLARSPDARARRDAAARLDDALDAAPGELPSAALVARVLATAPRRHRMRVRRYAAIAAPLAAAAGLVVWLARAPVSPVPALSEGEIAALDVYDTPTDALLASVGGDVFDEPPALGCSPGELGCLDLDLEQPGDSSRRETTEGMRA